MANVTHMWHRPPVITPNYGRKKPVLPKSNVPQVLLHDNHSQQHLLEVRLSTIHTERCRAERMWDLHRKAFLFKQSIRQQKHKTAFASTESLATSSSGSKSHSSSTNGYAAMPRSVKSSPLQILQRAHTSYDVSFDNGKSDGLSSPSAKFSHQNGLGLPQISSDSRTIKSSHIPGKSNGKSFTTYDFHLRREKTFAYGSQDEERPVSKTGRTVTLNDPRFLGLEGSLQRPDRPVDGFIQLSPSGHGVLQRYGEPLYDYDALRRRIDEYSSVMPSDVITSTNERALGGTSGSGSRRELNSAMSEKSSDTYLE